MLGNNKGEEDKEAILDWDAMAGRDVTLACSAVDRKGVTEQRAEEVEKALAVAAGRERQRVERATNTILTN